MSGILLAIEIIWVGGVIAIIGFYFIMKRKLRNKRTEAQTAETTADTTEELKSGRKQ